ncbi:uncharacterized protein TEOVI_000345200 [Trypanosoma equiperdum]|uniref:Trypanosomal VSG domain containing protein n=1 Tax=Trypanosoma equiperdum TaxID=5694 RepID=A0A1G4IHE1_TRYEQ|nr:hypothetical protein TEOVI_000345200 [Trypanosoma equiperdum]
MVAYCPKGKQTTLTAADLTAAIRAVEDKITIISGHGYLGAAISGCDGTAAVGLYVKFNNYGTNPDDSTANLPWLGGLKTLAHKLAQREINNHKATIATNGIKKNIAAVKFAVSAAVAHAKLKAADSTLSKPSSGPTQGQQTVCAGKGTNTTCTAAGCKWEGKNETDGECKARPGTENPATGTGEKPKEGEAATGCARHGTDKKACENDKTDGKQNCAWRKGKDGEDDREKRRQRNYEMLVFLSVRKFL